jgi:anaerobic magnesium-protoporphyrin IX monomethyl ester cyclase
MSKTAKIALVNPPILKGVYHHQLFLPIGLAYLAAVLKTNRHEVTVIDCPASEMGHEQLKAKVASFEPDVVGITSMTPTIQSTLMSARVAKEACPNAVVTLGGPHATFMDRQILEQEAAVDVVVRGEGEQTLLEIAQNVTDSKSLHKVDGITFRNSDQIIQTPNRPFIQKLDELPYPAYDYFQLDRYRLFGKLFLPIITSRGCPFQCSFCTTSRILGKEYRARSPKNIVDELEFLKNTYGADAFTFYDDTLTLDKNRIFKICEGIKARKINLPWDCQTRVDQVSREVLAEMRETKCQQVFFGVESGCQEILDAVKKRTTVEQNAKAIKLAKEAGLFVAISIMIGYPGETKDMLRQTLDFIRKTEPDDVYLCVATPYPGTELRRLVEEMGLKMSADWGLYDTVTPVFDNPLLPAEDILKLRKEFFDSFYSPKYVLRHLFKGNFYSRIMARTALNHIIWRVKSHF